MDFRGPLIATLMSAAADSSQRLQRLAHILAESQAAPGSASAPDRGPTDIHLDSVSRERISRLTSELAQRATIDTDDTDRLTVRLLLNEYTAAVAHLRAAARLTEQRMLEAAGAIQETRRHLRRQKKHANS
jgi:hypothetical protein